MLQYSLPAVAYLLGSISSAIIVCRLLGFADPRNHGSHNPGATNVLRIAGKKAAALTLLGDAVKGLLPVLLAKLLHSNEPILALTALAAFLGHLYPIFFRFQGGKGVATAFGALTALAWPVGLAVLLTWLGVAWLMRISSLSALISAVLAPVYMLLFVNWQTPWVPAISVLLSIILIWRHRSNIHNLIAGTEGKIGEE